MKLTVTLSAVEEANIHGWVNKGLADPAFANFPWRIVLEERTRARFDEIAAQFNPPSPPIDVTIVDLAWGDSARKYTKDFVGPFKANAIAVRVVTPAMPASYGESGKFSMSEWQEPATARHMTLSLTPGDFRDVDSTGVNGPIAASYGTTTMLSWNVGGSDAAPERGLKPGATYYFNFRNWSGSIGMSCDGPSCGASFTCNFPR